MTSQLSPSWWSTIYVGEYFEGNYNVPHLISKGVHPHSIPIIGIQFLAMFDTWRYFNTVLLVCLPNARLDLGYDDISSMQNVWYLSSKVQLIIDDPGLSKLISSNRV